MPVAIASNLLPPDASPLPLIPEVADTQFPVTDVPFTLDGPAKTSAFSLDSAPVAHWFPTDAISLTNPAAESVTGDWEQLWRAASRLPVTVIPEPATASLVVAGVIFLWTQRKTRTRR